MHLLHSNKISGSGKMRSEPTSVNFLETSRNPLRSHMCVCVCVVWWSCWWWPTVRINSGRFFGGKLTTVIHWFIKSSSNPRLQVCLPCQDWLSCCCVTRFSHPSGCASVRLRAETALANFGSSSFSANSRFRTANLSDWWKNHCLNSVWIKRGKLFILLFICSAL